MLNIKIQKNLDNDNYYQGFSINIANIIRIKLETQKKPTKIVVKERVKFSKKNKDADIRLRIDYHDFLNGDLQKKKELLLENIIESVRALGLKVKKDFDSAKLERDIIEQFKSEV